jgi:rhamnose utilization protein RhaD (predicted bifunctional aldolase and dehydrogenase)
MTHNPWNAEAAARCGSELALRAYSSRLLGSDPSLVLLGGGNTSVKLTGDDGEDLLYVKGTGADLAHVVEQDFTPLKLALVREMLRHSHLD